MREKAAVLTQPTPSPVTLSKRKHQHDRTEEDIPEELPLFSITNIGVRRLLPQEVTQIECW